MRERERHVGTGERRAWGGGHQLGSRARSNPALQGGQTHNTSSAVSNHDEELRT